MYAYVTHHACNLIVVIVLSVVCALNLQGCWFCQLRGPQISHPRYDPPPRHTHQRETPHARHTPGFTHGRQRARACP